MSEIVDIFFSVLVMDIHVVVFHFLALLQTVYYTIVKFAP